MDRTLAAILSFVARRFRVLSASARCVPNPFATCRNSLDIVTDTTEGNQIPINCLTCARKEHNRKIDHFGRFGHFEFFVRFGWHWPALVGRHGVIVSVCQMQSAFWCVGYARLGGALASGWIGRFD